jgi:hypothetical protein
MDTISNSDNYGIVKSAVIDYADISNIFKNNTKENIKDTVIRYYDGNEVGEVTNGTIDAVRLFTDLSAKNENKYVEDYFNSDSLIDNFRTLAKNAVVVNTIKDYSSERLVSTLA